MSVPSVNQESSSSQSEIVEPSEDCLLQTGSVLPMAQLPDTPGVSVSHLQHAADNKDDTRITTMLESDIDTKERTLRPTTPDTEEQLSYDLCTVSEHSANRTAQCPIAGPSTCEPTMDYSVLLPALSLTETHMIHPRTVELSKRKESGKGHNRDKDLFTEENLGDTARIKRRRTDVTDTCDVSDTLSLLDCMKTMLGLVPANNTQQALLPHPSNLEESNDIFAQKDNADSFNFTFTTKSSFNEEAGDLVLSAAINEAPNNGKGQTSDQEQCEDVANQRSWSCETRSCKVAENPANASLKSETLTVTGDILTDSWSEHEWRPPMSYSCLIDRIPEEARKAQTGPHVLIKANQSPDKLEKLTKSKSDKTKSAIDKEYDSLLKYMNPIPVINIFKTDEEFGRGFSIQDIENSSSNIQINRKLVAFVKENGLGAYSKLKQCLAQTEQRLLVTMLEMLERNEDSSAITWVLEHQHQQTPPVGSLIEDFREDLISYYRDNEATISLSPMVEEYDVPLMDFYIRPPMTAFAKPHILSKSTEQRKLIKENDETFHNKKNDDSDQKKKIASYKELFFQEDGSPFTKIYLTAPAGMGKSSFSQHVTMYWCQSHKPVELSADKYRIDDLKTMKKFDILFLLHLRKCEGKCNLDDLVIDMCSNLSRRSRYNREFLENVLHERRCLVVLDGLDEWNHPISCHKKPCVPHNNHPNNCTVLTTTRHWKLATGGLSSAHIDRLVEIDEFDKNTSIILERNVIAILNERGPRNTQISLDDFHTAISSIQSDEIFNTPYIKLQLITLFYDGIPISKSRCEIYCSIIELTLRRGLKKANLPLIQTSQPDDKTVILCLKNNKSCKLYSNLISKIGKLAFFSLFNDKKESRLIFHENIVSQYLTEFELDFCLKTGLLCQTKDSSMLSEKWHKIFFQHKSVQEFFAGLHISAEWRNDITRATFLKECQSLSEILDMSNVLIFVCGMSPDVFSALFCEIREVVEGDTITRSYRSTINDHEHIHMVMDSNVQTMTFYQELQVSCFKENVNNGNDAIKITLQDLILYGHNRDKTALTAMLTSNPQYLKSLYMDIDMFYAAFKLLWDEEFIDSLYHYFPTFLEILTSSVYSLTTVCLKHMTMKRDILCSLFKYFANMKTLNAIFMSNIGCSDWLNVVKESRKNFPLLKLLNHSKLQQTSGKEILHIKFDLSQASQLKQLHLAYIPLSQLVLPKTSELQQLHLEGTILSHLDLSQTSNIQKLHFENMLLSELDLSQNSQLKHIHLEYITLSQLDLSQNNHLQQLHLEFIPLSKLDLSQISQLQQLHLENIPIRKLDLPQTIQLNQLHVENIPISKLDLSHTSHLQHLHLVNIPLGQLDLCHTSQLNDLHLTNNLPGEIFSLTTNPLRVLLPESIQNNEFRVNVACLEQSIISSLPYSLPHYDLCRLTESIQNAKHVKNDILRNIHCLNHNKMCIGNALKFSEHVQLEELQLHNTPISLLDISQTCQLQALDLQNMPLSALNIYPYCRLEQLQLKEIQQNDLKLNAERITKLSINSCVLNHNSFHELVNFIQRAKNLSSLTLINIHCLHHTGICPEISLKLCQLGYLRRLHLQKIGLMELHLPQNRNYLGVTSLSLVQITMPTEACKQMFLSMGNTTKYFAITLKQETMSASALKEVFLSTDNLPLPVSVELNRIEISDKSWTDVFRTISGLSKPLHLKLSDIKMSESEWTDLFRVISILKQPVSLELSNIAMSDSAWTDVFHTISNSTQSVSLALTNIQMSDSAWMDVFRTISNLTQSVSLALTNIQMSDSAWTDVIQTFGSFTKPLALKLTNITMSDTAWKELFLSIGNLSQPLKLSKITMSATAWHELLIDTVTRVPKSVTVKLRGCMGLSDKERVNIQTKMLSTSAFSSLCYP